jgi:hypothetical protein
MTILSIIGNRVAKSQVGDAGYTMPVAEPLLVMGRVDLFMVR